MKTQTIEYDKSLSTEKRKKAGVFYSPINIVDYILNVTVGALFENKISIENLQNIKILDPACGDGIFLIEAYKKLIHYYQKNFKDFKNPEKFIVENNLFGVDTDKKAVELSIKKLYEASGAVCKNIQQGNSLIADETIAGNLAFDWNTRFENVMQLGGFDVIIGNPPYIYSRNKKISESEQIYYRNNYSFIQHRVNTYFLFIEKSYKLLNNNGYLGFIIPNTWMTVNSFSELREFIITKTSELSIINIFDKMFSDANVDTCLLRFKKDCPTTVKLGEFRNNEINILGNFTISDFQSPDYLINFSANKNILTTRILEKINANSKPLEEYAEIVMGIVAYIEGEGKPTVNKEDIKKRIYHSFEKKDETWVKYFDGKDIKRYTYNWSGLWIKYGINLARRRQEHLFTNERILIKQIPSPPPYCLNAVFVNQHFVNDINSTIIYNFKISPFYILALINSKLVSYWFINTFDKFQRKLFPQFKGKDLKQFPILIPTEEVVNKLQSLAIDLQKISIGILLSTNNFAKRIADNYTLVQITNKLYNFYSYDFKIFVNEINKHGKKLSLKQQDELEEYFTENKNNILSKKEIQQSIDKQIDTLVYELYKLSPEEIDLIENYKYNSLSGRL